MNSYLVKKAEALGASLDQKPRTNNSDSNRKPTKCFEGRKSLVPDIHAADYDFCPGQGKCQS